MDRKLRVLFLCGGNSCRSQMAEALLRSLAGDRVETASAGLKAEGVHPQSIRALDEMGLDITHQQSKSVDDLETATWDVIVTLCQPARDLCVSPTALMQPPGDAAQDTRIPPVLAGNPHLLHWQIPDPAKAEGSEDEVLAAFRAARDEIHDRITGFIEHGYLAALAEERHSRRQLLDGLTDGVLIHDDNQIFQVMNRAAEQLTGMSRDQVLGRRCHDVFGDEGLCGGQCDFRDGAPGKFARKTREVVFTNVEGEDRRVRMVVNHVATAGGKPDQVVATLHDVTELDQLRARSRHAQSLHGMVALSASMKEVFETIRQVSTSDYPTLILGDSGTGKELTANAIHNESRRKGGPFVPINCGALPENILESELFGHVRGAFTGAIREKKGRFELADGGTLFLDEVGELSPAFQVRLLRVLQEKRFEKVGGERTVSVDVRIISATNRDLRQMVADGEFREDLFYRLCVVPITLPPLRDRREDIPLIIEQVLGQIRDESGKDIRSVSSEAIEVLLGCRWPGNIRELINALQFASVRCQGEEILAEHLPPFLVTTSGDRVDLPSASTPEPGATPRRRRKLTVEAVREALAETDGNKVKAAKVLGVGRATLYRFLSDHPVS